MSNANALPDPAFILDLIAAFRRSKTLFAAISLGVFDALENCAKPADLLAAELRCNPDALRRLLDACVGLRLLENTPAGFVNAPATAVYLARSSPQRVTSYARYSNDVLWRLWTHLEDAVREGSNRWKQGFDWDGPIFAHFFREDGAKREFLMGMHGYGLLSSPHVVSAFDLSSFQHLVDLGGATGHLAIAACQRYPSLRATVFDLPDAVPLARELCAASDVNDRIAVEAGDFFADPLPAADLYALGRILHDWSEDKVVMLLGKIHERLPHGGGLLIAEKLLDEDRSGPVWAQMQSLNMLVCTEGKERTPSEYEGLLRRVGFAEIVTCRTPSPLDAVLARKR